MEKYIVAIEFGSSKIACVAAQRMDFGIRIATYRVAESAGISKGEVSNIKQTIEIASNLLRQTSQEIGVKITNVIVGISGQYIKTIEATNERTRKDNSVLISDEEIQDLTDEMMKFKLGNDESIIHVLPQHYNVDDEMGVVDPVGMIGDKIQAIYKLVVGRSRVHRNLNTALNMMKIKADDIIFKGIASAHAVLSEDDKEVGVACVDIGGGTTDITIVKDKIYRYCKSIPFGGNVITEDIRKAFGISFKKAEQLKRQFGSCYSDIISDNKSVEIVNGNETKQIKLKSIALVIEARMVEILLAVDYEIRKSGMESELSNGIVFTGGGAMIMHLQNLAKHIFQLNTRIVYPQNIMEDSCEDAFSYEASTAVGLASMAIDYNLSKEANSSLIEEEPAPGADTAGKPTDGDPEAGKDGKDDNPTNITVIDDDNDEKKRPKSRSFFNIKNVLTKILEPIDENKEV